MAEPDGRVLLGLTGTTSAGHGRDRRRPLGDDRGHGLPGGGPLEAAALAAHVHGRAGARGPGEGLVAGDLPDLVAEVLSDLRSSRRSTGGRTCGGSRRG